MDTHIDTYVACAMSALPQEEYDALRTAIVALCDELEAHGFKPYSEPFEMTDADDFDPPAVALRKNLAVLDGVKRFMLVHTHKEGTSALIELGYALHCKVPIIVFAKEGVKLPYYLSEPFFDDGRSITIVPFGDYEQLPTLAVSHTL